MSLFYRLVSPVRSLYWRILKPSVFGVRVLIFNPDDKSKFLTIRHSYGNREAWNIPGGGYNPKRETPKEAVTRETHEEIGVEIKELKTLGIYESGGEGKHDTVTMFTAELSEPFKIKLGPELSEFTWSNEASIKNSNDVASVLREALKRTYSDAA